eukprot:470668_1
MASEVPKKAPGKLKFNAAMFNKAMGNQKPGAKNPLEQKKKSGPPKPLKPPEDQFSRPTAPRRRVKSKHKLDLDAETKEEANKFYNQSFIAQTEQESKDNSDESDPNTTQNTADNPTDDAEDTNTDDNHTNDAEDTNTDDVTNKLDSALQDRASKDELHDKQILKHPKIDASLQPQADNLEKQLETRTPVSPGYVDDKVAPALAAAAKALDRNLRSDRVSQALKPEKRSTVQSLQDQGVLQSTNVAPSLAATSRLLDKKLTTDKLNQKLGDDDRKTFDELTDKGVIPHSNLSYNLRQNAKKLEQAQRKDQVSKGLKDRQSVDDLHESGVYAAHPHEVAPSMHGAASDLQKSMQKDAVSKGLRDRQTVEELHESGVLAEHPSDMAPSMHRAAKSLRVSMNKDQLRQGLRDRRTVDALKDSGILSPKDMDGAAKDLEKSMQKDQLSKGLRDRPDADALKDSNILSSHAVAPSMHGAASDLQKSMQKDALHQGLRDRQTVDDLHESGVLAAHPEQVAPSMHGAAKDLEKSMQKDQLSKVLRDRPDADELARSGILSSNPEQVAASMHGTAAELQKTMNKDAVNKGLRDRQTVDDLAQSGVLASHPDQIAPSMQGTAKDLEKSISKDAVHKGLRDRPDADELARSNILSSHPEQVAPSIQAVSNELQKSQTKDSLKQGLENRSTLDDLTQSNVLTSHPDQIAPSIHAVKNDLQKEMAKDSLKQGLQDRSTVDDLTQSNVLTNNPEQIAPSIQAARNDLQRSLAKDGLKQGLRDREELETLHGKNIITRNVDPKIAAHKRALSHAKKVDLLNERLIDPERPDNEDLVEQGILYSSTMSPAIQSNAKELEEQMRQQQHNRDLETTSSPSNEQSPTATDIEEEEYERLTKRKKQDNNQPAAHLTKKQIRSDRKRVSKLLDTRFGNRKSPQELEIRGLLPKDYFDDPATAYEMRYVQRKLAKEDLKRKLKGRTPVGEIVQRGIAQNDFWKKTPEEIRQDRRRELKQHKKELKHRLHKDRRPSVHDLVAQQIMPEDTAVIQELKNIAHSHKRMESAVKDLATHLPFEEEINKSVAATMMRHVNATEEDVDLEDCDTDDLFSDDDHKPNKRGDDEEDSDIDYNASSDIEDHKDENAIKFDLDTTVKKNYKRRLSQTIEHFIQNKPNIKELEERGVLKQTALAHSLRGSAVELEERFNNKMTHRELVARNIIKRPSISNSLQPNAEALEAALILNLLKLHTKEMERETVEEDDHPLFKRETGSDKRKKRGKHGRTNSGFGTKMGQNPTYYKHDIAPKLQGVANRLHMRRVSQQLENKLNARPTQQELVDHRILYKERMAHQLQGNAKMLEDQLRQRVPEKYLKMIGVLLHDQDTVAPRLQGASHELEYALRRRPSLFDGANQDIVKILGIPSDYADNANDFYTNELFKAIPRDTPIVREDPLEISAAFEEMYPDDTDKNNYRLRRARNSDKLEKRMSRRMSQTDMINSGVIPANYFEDPHEAVEMQQIRRKLAAEDLKRGLRNRSTVDELVQRGLTRYEYFEMDMDEARREIALHSQSTKKQVEVELNSIFNPQLIELEKRGIVEEGYFMTRAAQIAEGHRRLPSVTAELQQKLLQNPGYNEELAKTLVSDLRSDSDDNEYESGTSDDSEMDSDEEDHSDSGSSSDEIDSDDEEQARRLQELEYKIGHRPSTDELIEKRILYKKTQDMAASLQNAAKKLHGAMAKRPSLLDVTRQGILLEATNQDGLDTSSILPKKRKKRRKKKRNKKKHEHLTRKIGRRPTMVDLEIRGIVPRGYFDDVESAMKATKIKKENIIHDLTDRLQSRPEFSESLASKLMNKAIRGLAKKREIVETGTTQNDKNVIQGILNAKLAQRMDVAELKSKNIVSQNYGLASRLNASADALAKEHLKQKLVGKLNARRDEDELVDEGYLKYKGHGHNGLSASFQPVAVELEELIKTRVGEQFLEDRGYLRPERKKLNEAIAKRPSIAAMEDAGIVPHGAFHDLDAAQKQKHDRVQSIHDELNAFFGSDRRSKDELLAKGVFRMAEKKRGSIEIAVQEEEEEEEDESQIEYELSPDIPPVPERNTSSMFQQNTYTEIVMNSITFHNKKAIEPSYSIDLLVAEPDLSEQMIATSTLSFLNVFDNLNSTISSKIEHAKSQYLVGMAQQSQELRQLKNLLRALEEYGLAILEEEEFAQLLSSSGDVDRDIENVWKQINAKQLALYGADEEYMALHLQIKQMTVVRDDLGKYCDEYKIELSQLKRVQQRITAYIEENKMTKDSAMEAIKATDSNQAWMISKITNKIAALQTKIDHNESSPDNENFLNGLKEFLVGLKKLRKSSEDKIEHLDAIIGELEAQQAEIGQSIRDIRQNAMTKLDEIRHKYVAINDEEEESKYNNNNHEDDNSSGISELSSDDAESIQIVDFSQSAPLSMLELMHKREKYMTKVYKKIHDLESRAQTTTSTDYLRGLTEIRELQMILNNSALKYFYNHFVAQCNEIFNDCCLAQQAILENTAEINQPLLTNLKGISLLSDVLTTNKLSNEENEKTEQYLDAIVEFIQSLPDREVVIMQIARHLALSLPNRSFIVQIDEEENEHHLIKIDKFITNKIREWIGSILNIYGNNTFSSVSKALENDVVAQVRPSYCARLIVNCVYGQDVSL